MSENTEEIQSPCIGVCSMNEDAGLCYGCYRTVQEIKDWWNMTPVEQKNLLSVLALRQDQTISFDD
ncbi:MAG: DUF1289 domain-containing protein [Methylotenera sp.]|nr:DUF1289 domain-containing protein [Methylotenera sp.]